MNHIQIKEVDITLCQVVLEDIQYLKQHLDDTLVSSDQTLIKNLIEETESLVEDAKNVLKTYQERYEIFHQLSQSWFKVWNHYKNIPEAIELIKWVDHMTNYSIAYSYLCLSLSLINEGRTSEYKADLERIVSGFLLLSEIIDVFTRFFSTSELGQIYDGARDAISVSARDIIDYFENEETSNLVTQLRAYSSLIVLKIEEHIKNTKSTPQTALKALNTQFWQDTKLNQLLATQSPTTVDDLNNLTADFWPEEDGIEDFLTFLRQQRQEVI
ncbi:MAG TPA: hypothetical protein V6C84_29000 [Coleofasciculaceae cyanobacterium]|jgi:hypothetical protein